MESSRRLFRSTVIWMSSVLLSCLVPGCYFSITTLSLSLWGVRLVRCVSVNAEEQIIFKVSGIRVLMLASAKHRNNYRERCPDADRVIATNIDAKVTYVYIVYIC